MSSLTYVRRYALCVPASATWLLSAAFPWDNTRQVVEDVSFSLDAKTTASHRSLECAIEHKKGGARSQKPRSPLCPTFYKFTFSVFC